MNELKTGVAYREVPAGTEARYVHRQFPVPTVVCGREPGVFVPNMARIYRTALRLANGHVVSSQAVIGKSANEAPFVYLVEIPDFSTHEIEPLRIMGWMLLTEAQMEAMTEEHGSLAQALSHGPGGA